MSPAWAWPSGRLVLTPSFLPAALLQRWRRRCEAVPLPDPTGEWSYTTNDGYVKVRSNEEIGARRREVEAAYERGDFAYSKWEPRRSCALYAEVHEHLRSAATLARLSAIVGEEIVGFGDLYLTIFAQGDFLSQHEDRGLGKYAFTISLSSLGEGDGGKLRLYAPTRVHELRPRANDLTIFSLAPVSCPHEVERVTGSVRRCSIAGFLATRDVEVSRAFVDEAAGTDT
jgi:hypothetical protein